MLFHIFLRQVANISANPAAMSRNDFVSVFAEIIQNCCQPLCMAWLEEELSFITVEPNKACFLAQQKLG